MSNQSSFSFQLIIYASVIWNVRICIGFKVTGVAPNDVPSKQKQNASFRKDFLFMNLLGRFM